MAEAPSLRLERVPGLPGGPLEEGLVLHLPSLVSLVDPAVELIAAHCFAGREPSRHARFRLRTVLAEALANAIQCGNREDPDRRVQVQASLFADHVQITVTDEGGGFDPTRAPDPLHPDRLTAPRGRGLFIIRSLALDVGFSEKGNAIWMTLPRS